MEKDEVQNVGIRSQSYYLILADLKSSGIFSRSRKLVQLVALGANVHIT